MTDVAPDGADLAAVKWTLGVEEPEATLAGEGLARWPRRGEIGHLRARHPGARIMYYPKRGADLRREMKWLGSYRYGVVNLGARSPGELFAAYDRINREVGFHPPSVAGCADGVPLGQAAAD